MDVNKPDGVHAVGDQPHRPPQKRHQDDTPEDDEQARQDRRHSWSLDAAVDVDGVLAGAVTPEVQKILDGFAAKIEPMRQEMERAKAREAHYREIAAGHPFLPVPNRREFLHELSHVINNLDSLSPPAALMLIHMSTIHDMRLAHGRKAADRALIHAAESIVGAIHPTDAAGSLGGEDFGVILLNGDQAIIERRIQNIRTRFKDAPFTWLENRTELSFRVGTTILGREWSAEHAIEMADRSLLAPHG